MRQQCIRVATAAGTARELHLRDFGEQVTPLDRRGRRARTLAARATPRDFLDVGDFYMLCHRDDTVVRQNHPEHIPMSTTIISFYKARDTPIIYIERHGSMSLEHTIAIIEKHGFKFKATEAGTKRLGHRD